jgi:uncharacterized damage-inducible protein DinB
MVDDGELSTARAFLDFARHCVLKKCEGLDDDQLRRVLVPSGTNLLGLVQHMTVGERYWYGWHVAGAGEAGEDAFDFGMDVPLDHPAARVLEEFQAACVESDAVIERVAAQPDHLDSLTARPVGGERRTLRWVLAHTTSESTRHAGHADVLRELLDGVTGR